MKTYLLMIVFLHLAMLHAASLPKKPYIAKTDDTEEMAYNESGQAYYPEGMQLWQDNTLLKGPGLPPDPGEESPEVPPGNTMVLALFALAYYFYKKQDQLARAKSKEPRMKNEE